MPVPPRSNILLAAAVAALPLLAITSPASAQVPAGQDGRAADANPRVGSGGFNTANNPPNYIIDRIQNGNRIITGNVTGFDHFRGIRPYTDPREFRGNVGTQTSDDFIRRSSGVPQSYSANPLPNINTSQPFYGGRLANPSLLPEGFVQQGVTGTYTPTGAQPPQADRNRIDARISSSIRPFDLMLPGQVDPDTGLPQMITASPLLGVRAIDFANPNDRSFLAYWTSLRQENALSRLHLDPRTVQKLRDELSDVAPGVAPNTNDIPGVNQPNTPRNPNQIKADTVTPFETPENRNIGESINSTTIGGQPLTNTVRQEGSTVRRLVVPPRRQSSQYAELEKRLARYYSEQLETDEQRNREFLTELRAYQQGQAANAPGPDFSRISRALADRAAASNANRGGPAFRPPPTRVESIAAGIQQPGLASLLKRAEEQLQNGKYVDAMKQYQAAADLAPNNRMILIGLVNAELGAGFYQTAERHLRAAFAGDPVLTLAQFDLQKMIGQERLGKIVQDLKAAAQKNERDPGLPLLLAYLAYNTPQTEAQAKIYLDLAEKRAGNQRDPVLQLLRTHWHLPADGAGEGPATRPAAADNVPPPLVPAPDGNK
jgi:hypothetical protein